MRSLAARGSRQAPPPLFQKQELAVGFARLFGSAPAPRGPDAKRRRGRRTLTRTLTISDSDPDDPERFGIDAPRAAPAEDAIEDSEGPEHLGPASAAALLSLSAPDPPHLPPAPRSTPAKVEIGTWRAPSPSAATQREVPRCDPKLDDVVFPAAALTADDARTASRVCKAEPCGPSQRVSWTDGSMRSLPAYEDPLPACKEELLPIGTSCAASKAFIQPRALGREACKPEVPGHSQKASSTKAAPAPRRGRHRADAAAPLQLTQPDVEDFDALSEQDRQRIVEKWRRLAGPAGSPGALRFQMLVAAIVHPKANETVVRGAMARLRSLIDARDGASGAAVLASCPKEALEEAMKGVHWHKVKATRLVAASAKLLERWAGRVPTTSQELLTVPGIGPKLARLLTFLFEDLDETAPEGNDCGNDEASAWRGGDSTEDDADMGRDDQAPSRTPESAGVPGAAPIARAGHEPHWSELAWQDSRHDSFEAEAELHTSTAW